MLQSGHCSGYALLSRQSLHKQRCSQGKTACVDRFMKHMTQVGFVLVGIWYLSSKQKQKVKRLNNKAYREDCVKIKGKESLTLNLQQSHWIASNNSLRSLAGHWNFQSSYHCYHFQTICWFSFFDASASACFSLHFACGVFSATRVSVSHVIQVQSVFFCWCAIVMAALVSLARVLAHQQDVGRLFRSRLSLIWRNLCLDGAFTIEYSSGFLVR